MTCPNCGEPAPTPYCPQCGQRQGDLRPSLRHVGDDLVRFFLRVDGRFVATLKGLLKPGFLTSEYLAGRRERYEKPLRLFVVTLALSLLVTPAEAFVHLSINGAKISSRGDAPPEARVFIDALSAHMQLLSLLFVLYGTLVLTLVYRKQGVRFAEHFILMLHLGTQSNLVGLLLTPVRLMSPEAWSQLSSVISTVLFVMALKRVHGEPWKTVLKRSALFAVIGIAIFVAFAVVVGLTSSIVIRGSVGR